MAGASSTDLRPVLGLMSGTSLEGIDVAIIETDGRDQVLPGPLSTIPCPPTFRERLRLVLGGIGPVAKVGTDLTSTLSTSATERHSETPPSAFSALGRTVSVL
jgi:anhydro-N-acetylmuramic acid kinase